MNNQGYEDKVASILCEKNSSISCEQCFSTSKGEICKHATQCRISEKTNEQLEYVVSSIKDNVFLEACPGSGKTEVVGMKAAYEIKQWEPCANYGIAILSFTNHAVNVIQSRVDEFCSKGHLYPHYIGTVSSFIMNYISQAFGYRLIDYPGRNGDCSFRIVERGMSLSTSKWLGNYKCQIRKIKKDGKPQDIYSNQIVRDKRSGDYLIPKNKHTDMFFKEHYESEVFQSWLRKDRIKNNQPLKYQYSYCRACFDENKRKFLKSGFANFEDLNNLALSILKNNYKIAKIISRRFPLIIIDECQDLSWVELEIFRELKNKGTKIHFVGDLNQSVYKFKRVDPELVRSFVEDFSYKTLTKNFRSNNSIVKLINKILIGSVEMTWQEYEKFENQSLLYIEYSEPIEAVESYLAIVEHLEIDKGKSVVLVKQNTLREELLATKADNEKNYFVRALHLWKQNEFESRKKALELAGKQIAKWFGGSRSKRNYYCPNEIESMFYWRLFLKNVLNDCCEDENLMQREIEYKLWYKRARQVIPSIIEKHYQKIKRYDTKNRDFSKIFGGRWFNAKESNQLIPSREDNRDNKIDIMTIHASKGCTFDSTLVLSSATKRSESGHWKKHWIDGVGEDKRVGYVAVSRAKHLLVLGVPKLSESELEIIEKLGFANYKTIFSADYVF